MKAALAFIVVALGLVAGALLDRNSATPSSPLPSAVELGLRGDDTPFSTPDRVGGAAQTTTNTSSADAVAADPASAVIADVSAAEVVAADVATDEQPQAGEQPLAGEDAQPTPIAVASRPQLNGHPRRGAGHGDERGDGND